MALLFMDGFDHIEDGAHLVKWDYSDNILYLDGYGRTGGYGVAISYVGYLERVFQNTSSVVVGFAHRVTGYDRDYFLQLRDSTSTQIALRYNPSGVISAYRGTTLLGSTAPGIFPYNTWKYIELKVVFSSTSGTVEVRVDGQSVLSLSGIVTVSTSNEYFNLLSIRGSNSFSRFDDLYVCDTTGTENNDFLGDVVVETLYPIADGSVNDFTPLSGVDNYAMVDDPQLADASTYNSSTTVGDKDLFDMSTFSGSVEIFGVQVTSAVQNLDAGGTIVTRPLLKSGTTPTETEGDDKYVGSSLSGAIKIFDKEPIDDVSWTTSNVNAIEAGIKVES